MKLSRQCAHVLSQRGFFSESETTKERFMIIVQLCDLNLRADGCYPRHDSGETLATAVAVIQPHCAPAPDAVLFTRRHARSQHPRLRSCAPDASTGSTCRFCRCRATHDDLEAFCAAFADRLAFARRARRILHMPAPTGSSSGLDSNGPERRRRHRSRAMRMARSRSARQRRPGS